MSKRATTLIQDGRTYLQHCLQNNINTESTVFKGTLYELYVKKYLESNFYAKDLIKCGGSYDNGIDIIGKWDLDSFLNNSLSFQSSKKLHSKSLANEPIQNDIQLLVQCKNFKKKLGASTIRELSGVLDYYKFNKKSTFMFIVSPQPITNQAISQLDKSSFGIINLSISTLKNNIDHYNYDLWKGGELNSIYLNKIARNLLDGFHIEKQVLIA
ncbi:RRG7 [Candida pseudojiufengensis]|uniref:RRG7 n=1 Tax=Candida pseudojiufengensis TaxID=497109 RepID=UPI0022244D7B|nr:RRG7 [Candida pseudojiufengensis]KAI5959266.1 RRG7 [Candida pseudojiufengensis]